MPCSWLWGRLGVHQRTTSFLSHANTPGDLIQQGPSTPFLPHCAGGCRCQGCPGHRPPPASLCSGGSWHQHGCPMPWALRGAHVLCGSANLAAVHKGFCTSWGWESLCCFYMFAWYLKRAVLLGLITAMSSSPGRISHTSYPPRGTQLRDVLQEP